MAAGWTIVYTGVGKVNAAIALGDAIAKHQPKQVVNYGSAGALRPGLAGLHRVTRFLQRDMDVRALGFALGQTPFEDDGEILAGTDGLNCGTGDQFVSAPVPAKISPSSSNGVCPSANPKARTSISRCKKRVTR